jgi:hypothetical protein
MSQPPPTPRGLEPAEAARRLAKDGPNALAQSEAVVLVDLAKLARRAAR